MHSNECPISEKKEKEILKLKIKEEIRKVEELSLELIIKQEFSTVILKKLRELDNISKSDLLNIEILINNELKLKSTSAKIQNQMGG